jgi:hypothetical protein
VDYAEVFAFLMNTAFAEQEYLVALGHGINGDCPFFERHLAFFG